MSDTVADVPSADEPSDDVLREAMNRVRLEVGKAVVGQDGAVTGLLIALLARGHVLLEGVPGVAKTLLVRAFSRAIGLDTTRIQFTPDLMPGDVTGSLVYDARAGEFEFRAGPVFTHVLLGDEINRTPPKTQAALLEAMEERQVSVDGQSRALPDPFLVAATQNPIEHEGTYALPEAQLDRFLLKLVIDVPAAGRRDGGAPPARRRVRPGIWPARGCSRSSGPRRSARRSAPRHPSPSRTTCWDTWSTSPARPGSPRRCSSAPARARRPRSSPPRRRGPGSAATPPSPPTTCRRCCCRRGGTACDCAPRRRWRRSPWRRCSGRCWPRPASRSRRMFVTGRLALALALGVGRPSCCSRRRAARVGGRRRVGRRCAVAAAAVDAACAADPRTWRRAPRARAGAARPGRADDVLLTKRGRRRLRGRVRDAWQPTAGAPEGAQRDRHPRRRATGRGHHARIRAGAASCAPGSSSSAPTGRCGSRVVRAASRRPARCASCRRSPRAGTCPRGSRGSASSTATRASRCAGRAPSSTASASTCGATTCARSTGGRPRARRPRCCGRGGPSGTGMSSSSSTRAAPRRRASGTVCAWTPRWRRRCSSAPSPSAPATTCISSCSTASLRARVTRVDGTGLLPALVDAMAPVEAQLIDTDWDAAAAQVRRLHDRARARRAADGAGCRRLGARLPRGAARAHRAQPRRGGQRVGRRASDRAVPATPPACTPSRRPSARARRPRGRVRDRARRGRMPSSADAESLPPRVADRYLALKAAGRL